MKYSFSYNDEKIIIESNQAFRQWYNSGIINENTVFFDEEEKREISAGELAVILSEDVTDKNTLLENYQNRTNDKKSKSTEKRPIIKYILFSASIAIGIILSMLKGSFEADINISTSNSAFNFGYALGEALKYLFVFFVISIIIHKFSKSNKRINIHIIINIVLLVYLSYGVITSLETLNKDKQFESASRLKVSSILGKALKGERIEKEQFDSSTYGRYAELLKCTEEYYLKLQEASEQLNESSQEVNLDIILDVSIYTDNQQIAATRKTVSDVINSYEVFEKNRTTAINDYIHSAETLNLPSAYKRSFIEGVKNSKETTGEVIGEFNNAQKSILYCADEILELMQSLKGKYNIKNGNLMFNNKEDLEKYNKLVENLTNSIKKSNKLSEKINTQATDIKSEFE